MGRGEWGVVGEGTGADEGTGELERKRERVKEKATR